MRFFILLLFTFSVWFASGQTAVKERLIQHVVFLASDSLQGREAGTEFARIAADYIVEQFEYIGVEPYFDSTFFQLFDNNFQNVVGIIRGSDSVLKNEYIIIGAHFDHLGVRDGNIYNGADDNASGVAVLIELARKLKNSPSPLRRSVVLIGFDAEEIGLIGSAYFVNQYETIDHIQLMMSVDMVGWYCASDELIYEGSRTIRGGRNLILNPKFIPEGLSVTSRRFETHPFRGTDTRPFALKGIPTLAVTTGVKSPYHKPEDEAHLIDFNGMVLITEHLKNLIEFVANDTAYKASGRIAKWHRPQPRFILGFTANAGTNRHHYTAGAVTGKTTFSYGAGLFSQVNFGAMAIRPEVRYDRIRAKHPDGIISTDNLTIPLSLVVQHLRQGSGVGFFVGGYYTYRFDGTYRAEIMDFEKTFNREEKGLTFGFNIYARPIVIGFTRRVALTNFMQFPNADNAHLRNRTNYFTIGYFF